MSAPQSVRLGTMRAVHREDLQVDSEYTWEEMGGAFECAPAYFGSAGGMVSRPNIDALVIVTNASEGKSFEYHDRWEGPDLVYCGRGQSGDQTFTAQNRDLGENRRTNYVFVAEGNPRRMRFKGKATCAMWWWDDGPDGNGNLRRVLRFHLTFDPTPPPPPADAIVDEYVGKEGKRQIVTHLRIERDRGLAADAKRRWAAQDPYLRCSCCNLSFRETYGSHGDGYIEAHHVVPLSKLNGGAIDVRIADLAPVCANCHRMLHRRPEVSIADLRAMVLKPPG